MSQDSSSSPSSHLDPTFRNYSTQQAAAYAAHRGAYSSDIYGEIIRYHTTRGGEFSQVLDVGCGTGKATRQLAAYFSNATGVDPGEQMIIAAKAIGGETKNKNVILFKVTPAEDLDKISHLGESSVDLLSAAMAVSMFLCCQHVSMSSNSKLNLQAHWFDMSKFWPQAARIVKPGGTVALWTESSLYCRKTSSTIYESFASIRHRSIRTKRSRSPKVSEPPRR